MWQFIGHDLYSTNTEKLQKYTDLKKVIRRICKQNALLLSKMGNLPKKIT